MKEVEIMSFAENLRQIRKEKGLSQEELAELLDVSRQAVSKWELGDGYPEADKLLLLSDKLSVSLDWLMNTGYTGENSGGNCFTGEILITSPNENVIMKCTKVASSQEFKTGKRSPKYALYGVSGSSLLGENSTFLAWYADKDSISTEIADIQKAMISGTDSYELKYSANTEMHWGNVRIKE